jgi:hypothetical protein
MVRTGKWLLAMVGVALAAVIALAIGAGTVAALWTERWQFVAVAAVLVGLSLVVWLRCPPRP